MHLFASILLGSVDAAAINSRLAVPAGTWTTPTGLNVTVAALERTASFAAADPSDRRPMQKVTVHCPDGHYEEAFVAVLNATAELSPRDYVNQRADHYCKNPTPAQLQAQGFAVPQQLEKRGNWQETHSTFQFYEASRQEFVRMHHANKGCNYADSQIISSTVPLFLERVDFGKFFYPGVECVLTYYPHILAQEGQFRFAYMFRFRNNFVLPLNDDMVYDLCQNDYGSSGDRLPAWQGCDAEYPMRHNGVVLPPDNNPPPPPPPPAHNCPVNGHWSPQDNKCNCNDGFYWTGSQCIGCPRHSHPDGHGNCPCDGDFQWNNGQCIYQRCPQNGHWEVGQDKCVCNDGWYWWTNQCFKCPKHSHVTGGGNCACDNGFTWLNGECVSTICFANSHWDVGQDKCICNDGWYTWNNQCFKCPKHSHVTGGGNCGCDNGFTWLNGECVSTTCPRHSQWNVPQDRCICDNGYTWDGSNCISTQCPRHSHYDVPQDRCICDNDYLWDGSQCVYQKCPANGHYDGNQDKCVCNDGYYSSGGACVPPSCPRHAHFNWQSLKCDCDTGYNWDGSQCAPSCPQNGHYDPGQDKCVCNDGYHEDNGQCAKDAPPPPPPPPVPVPVPGGPIFVPPPIGPPQLPPKKTVPVKPPPTFSPSNTPTPTTTTPSEPTSTTSTSTTEDACSLPTNNIQAGGDPGRRYCACKDLNENIAKELFYMYLPGKSTRTGEERLYIGMEYVDNLVVDTCYAAKFLLKAAYDNRNDVPRIFNAVSSVLSAEVGGQRVSFQGFSAMFEGILPNDQNPAYCAREIEISGETEVPTDTPDQPREQDLVLIPVKRDYNLTLSGLQKRQSTVHGQCGEPHAYKRMIDNIRVGALEAVLSTASVEIKPNGHNRYLIQTSPRCSTCLSYNIFGDIPTDYGKIVVFKGNVKNVPDLDVPDMEHGGYTPIPKRKVV